MALNAEKLLLPANRQYRHNVGEGFVFGYDMETALKIVNDLIEANRMLKEQVIYLQNSR